MNDLTKRSPADRIPAKARLLLAFLAAMLL